MSKRDGGALRATNHRTFASGVHEHPSGPYVWRLPDVCPSLSLSPPQPDVCVAVLDSGVPDHPSLRELRSGFDVGPGESGADVTGHATAACGLLAADDWAVKGLLPGHRAMPIKVTDDAGVAHATAVAAGIVCAVVGRASVVVVTPVLHRLTAPLASAVGKAAEHGVIVVADLLDDAGAPPCLVNVRGATLPDLSGVVPHGEKSYCRVRLEDFRVVAAGAVAACLTETDGAAEVAARVREVLALPGR